ncbi:hypothetical protein ABGB07_02235 [Micromonosporaceae bacterium B7E4]
MTEPSNEPAPDVVPLLAFQVLDFVQLVLDQPMTEWQRRLLINLYGPGPVPSSPEETPHA